MADDPAAWEVKMRDIGMILENIMAVINLLRPHQARESVKTMLEKRLRESREEMEKCDAMKGRIDEFLNAVEDEGRRDKAESTTQIWTAMNGLQSVSEKRKAEETERARRLWAMLDDLDAD